MAIVRLFETEDLAVDVADSLDVINRLTCLDPEILRDVIGCSDWFECENGRLNRMTDEILLESLGREQANIAGAIRLPDKNSASADLKNDSFSFE